MNIKPMKLKEAALWFFGMSLIILIGLHVVTPFFSDDIPLYVLYYGSMSLPLLISVVLVIVFYKRETNNGVHSLSFKERFWLKKLSKKDFLYTVILVLFWFLTFIIINGVTSNFLSRPDYLQYEESTWFNLAIKGNYFIAIFSILFLILNVYGEELFWRGYMMPRLEKEYGENTWKVNGILWVLFHIPVFYLLPAIAPGAILLVYLVQRSRNTNVGVIGHFFLNGAELIPLIILVFSA